MTSGLFGITVLSDRGEIIAPVNEVGALLPISDAMQAALDDRAMLGGIIGPDDDWVIPAGAVHIVVPVLTASRTWSLTDVDAYPRGQDRVIVDEGRSLGSGPILMIVPLAGTGDTIAGFPNGLPLQDAGVSVRLRRGLLSDVWVLV